MIVSDENGDYFATAGTFIPPRADELCGFAHPQATGKFQASFIPAFVGCATLPGNVPNDMTEGGIPSCSPPETFNADVGNPPSGWFLDPARGRGRVTITPKKEPYRLASGAMNPEGQTGDLRLKLDISGVRDQAGPASGSGTLSALARMTVRDRRGHGG